MLKNLKKFCWKLEGIIVSDFVIYFCPGLFLFLLATVSVVKTEGSEKWLGAIIFSIFAVILFYLYYCRVRKVPVLKFLQPGNPEERYHVELDEQQILCRHPDNSEYCIFWHNLSSVKIRTTADGPFKPDVFWELSDGETQMSIPFRANGEEELKDYLLVLPKFDYWTFMGSMGSTSEAEFNCWQRSQDDVVEFAQLKNSVKEKPKDPEWEQKMENFKKECETSFEQAHENTRRTGLRCILSAIFGVWGWQWLQQGMMAGVILVILAIVFLVLVFKDD